MRYSRLFYKKFFLILGLYYILQIIIKINYGGVEYDDAEQFILSQHISLYYTNAQPPLYNWIQYIFFKIFGLNIFALALFKHILLFMIFYSYYILARELNLSKNRSILASSLLFLLPQISWGAEFKLTHSVLLLLVSIWTMIYILKLIKNPSYKNAIIFGIIMALGILSKYSYILLLLAIFIVLILDYKELIFSRYILLSIIVSAILVMPHLIAFISHIDEVVNSIMSKTDKNLGIIHGFISLIKSTFAFMAPIFIIFGVMFLKDRYIFNKIDFNFLEKIVLIIFVLIAFFILAGVFDDFKERWFLPYLFVTPLIFVIRIKSIKLDIFSYIITFVMVLLLVIFTTRLLFPDIIYKIKGKYSHDSIDYKYLKDYIIKNHSQPKRIYTDTLMLGGNIKRVFPNSLVNDFSSNKKVDLVIKESNFKGAVKVEVPYKFSKNHKIYYIKFN